MAIAPVVLECVYTTAPPSNQLQNFTAATKTCYVVEYVVKLVQLSSKKNRVRNVVEVPFLAIL